MPIDLLEVPKQLDAIVPVYRDAARADATIRALLACIIPDRLSFRVRVVDDGSNDVTPDLLAATFGERIDLIRLPVNRGRSAARNAAALVSKADYLLFVDGDCVPTDDGFITRHVAAMVHAEVSIGGVVGQDDGFWHDYQEAARQRRGRLSSRSTSAMFTTQNVMISRLAFFQAGGFDETYVGYGFEDRDLAIRLADAGSRFTYTAEAEVSHRDQLSLAGVCRKMQDAGKRNATIFANRYPKEYRELGYAAIDARLHPWRGAMGAFIWFCLHPITHRERWLQVSWIPFSVKKSSVRIMTAMAFMDGTKRSGPQDPLPG